MSYIHDFMPFLSPQRVCSRAGTRATVRIQRHVVFLHSEKNTQRRFYTQKPLHREGFTQSSFYADAFAHRRFYIQKLLHRKAFSKEALPHEAFTQSSFYTQTLLHRDAPSSFCTQTPPGFDAQKFLHISFTQTSFYTEKPRHSIFFTQKHLHTHTKALRTRLYTQSFYTQTLLRIEACSQSRVYTEQLLHTEAFTQREAFAQSSFYNLIHTETLNTQMPKLLPRQVFTHRGIYTKVLHTDAADASTRRSFWTPMPFHTEAFTQIRFDIYAPIHTEDFRHRLFFRESQKLWHREAFTQRIFYTQKLLHTSFSTEAFTQRSFWAQELLHTDAFTHRSLYTRRLLRTEAFTQRSFYTQTLSHRKTDSTE